MVKRRVMKIKKPSKHKLCLMLIKYNIMIIVKSINFALDN